MINPQGMFVKASTHDLYVANTGGHNIFVFHRGAQPFSRTPIPAIEPDDVTVAKDGRHSGNIASGELKRHLRGTMTEPLSETSPSQQLRASI